MNYENAVEVGDARHAKLNRWIDEGKQDAKDVFTKLATNVPRDFLVDTNELDFDIRSGRIFVQTADNEFQLHRHAVNQMVARTNILTGQVANKMIDAATEDDRWGRELLLHNLRTIFHKNDRERVLMRAVPILSGGQPPVAQDYEVRGFLSDKYRRLNCGPIFEQFAQTAMSEFGAVPVQMQARNRTFRASYYHDIRVGFSLFLPFVFSPIDGMRNEVMIIGLMVQNSDFGGAAFSVSMIVIRIQCSNLMVTENELRKVHLGARLAEDIRFSEDTYQKDTETMALATRDIVRTLFSEERVNGYTGRINRAAQQEVDADALMAKLRASGHLLKSDEKEIKKLYNSADIELMPAGNTAWRATNAIALFANELDAEGKSERAVEMRHAAGVVLDKHVQAA
jgi:hypothetical protein